MAALHASEKCSQPAAVAALRCGRLERFLIAEKANPLQVRWRGFAFFCESGIVPRRYRGWKPFPSQEIFRGLNYQKAAPKARIQGARVSRREAYKWYAAATAG
jgi:hypothetical protein